MKTHGLMARIGDHKSGGHHPWVSRDYPDIDCRATGCMFNINEKCATPSQCEIKDDGRCAGFTPKPTKKIEGD